MHIPFQETGTAIYQFYFHKDRGLNDAPMERARAAASISTLAGAGQADVERALDIMRNEIERDMKLMGITRLDQLNRDNLRFRRA